MSDLDKLTDQIEGVEPEVEVEAEAPSVDPDLAAEARKYGWKPQEEFTLDPKGWVPAEKFLDLPSTKWKRERDEKREIEKKFAEQSEQLSRIAGTTSSVIQRVREQERAQYEQQLARIRAQQVEAVQTADVEAYTAAKRQEEAMLRVAPQPEPAANPLMDKYDWTKDPEKFRYAFAAVEQTPGVKALSPERQWEWADKQVKQFFEPAQPTPAPTPPTHARVDGGGLAGMRKAGKSGADLPAEARKVGQDFVKDGLFPNLDAYAKEYFSQEGV